MFNTKNGKKSMQNKGNYSNSPVRPATGNVTSVPPTGAHFSPPLGGTSKTTSSGRGFLFSNGADINIQDGNGFTPLYEAVRNSGVNMVELLINRGADVNGTTEEVRARPPLNIAAKQGDRELVKLLLSHGADVNGQGYIGQTPIVLAMIDV